jgi:hypothetical protein
VSGVCQGRWMAEAHKGGCVCLAFPPKEPPSPAPCECRAPGRASRSRVGARTGFPGGSAAYRGSGRQAIGRPLRPGCARSGGCPAAENSWQHCRWAQRADGCAPPQGGSAPPPWASMPGHPAPPEVGGARSGVPSRGGRCGIAEAGRGRVKDGTAAQWVTRCRGRCRVGAHLTLTATVLAYPAQASSSTTAIIGPPDLRAGSSTLPSATRPSLIPCRTGQNLMEAPSEHAGILHPTSARSPSANWSGSVVDPKLYTWTWLFFAAIFW